MVRLHDHFIHTPCKVYDCSPTYHFNVRVANFLQNPIISSECQSPACWRLTIR